MARDFIKVLRQKYDAFGREPPSSIHIAVNKPLQLHQLTVVDLSRTRVATAGDDGAIRATSPRITELDLSYSRIEDWGEVVKIITQLEVPCTQRLDYIALSGIRIREDSILSHSTTFQHVTALSLCDSYFSEVSEN